MAQPRQATLAPERAGPYDADDIDPRRLDAPGIVDFGAVRVPVPERGTVAVEPGEGGRMQAVHVSLPEGRLSVSALAAPRSARLWPDLATEIDASLRDGDARVRSFQGEWGRELHATSGAATSVFVGVDGPRWMLYGVATGPTRDAGPLLEELRRMVRGTIVVRGRSPYPVRTVLPLQVPTGPGGEPSPAGPAAPTVVIRAVAPAVDAPQAGIAEQADRTVAIRLAGPNGAGPGPVRPGSMRAAGGFPSAGAGRAQPGTPPPAVLARPAPPHHGPRPPVRPDRAQPTFEPAPPPPGAGRDLGPAGGRAIPPAGRRRAPEPSAGGPSASVPRGAGPSAASPRRGRHAAPEPAEVRSVGSWPSGDSSRAEGPAPRPAPPGPAGGHRVRIVADPVTEPLPLIRPAVPTALPAGRHRRRE